MKSTLDGLKGLINLSNVIETKDDAQKVLDLIENLRFQKEQKAKAETSIQEQEEKERIRKELNI